MSFADHFSPDELIILQERAERIAGRLGDTQQDMQTALLVKLGVETYAFALEQLVTIIEDVVITPVPCVPAFVAGVANVRGRILPVMDLAHLLGLPTPEARQLATLIVVAHEATSLAFKVEQIDDLVSLERSTIKPLPLDFDVARPEFFSGLTPEGYTIINTAVILGADDLIVDEHLD